MKKNELQILSIWGLKSDLFILLSPLLFSAVFSILVNNGNYRDGNIDYGLLYYHYIFFDFAHVIFSLFIVASDARFAHKNLSLLVMCLVLTILLNYFIYSYDQKIFLSFILLFNHFHFIKQDWGFFCLTETDNKRRVSFSEKATLYLPMIFYMIRPHTNPILFWSFLLLCIYFLAVVIRSYIVRYKTENKLESGKILILIGVWSKTLIGYLIAYYNSMFIISALLLHHAIPFIYHSFIYRKKTNQSVIWATFFYIISVFLSIKIAPGIGNILHLIPVSLMSIIYIPSVFHYLIDGFFWKKNYNPYLTQIAG